MHLPYTDVAELARLLANLDTGSAPFWTHARTQPSTNTGWIDICALPTTTLDGEHQSRFVRDATDIGSGHRSDGRPSRRPAEPSGGPRLSPTTNPPLVLCWIQSKASKSHRSPLIFKYGKAREASKQLRCSKSVWLNRDQIEMQLSRGRTRSRRQTKHKRAHGQRFPLIGRAGA